MNNCKKILVLWSIFSNFLVLSNNIFVINSFQEALPTLNKASKKTLVLFDLDHTLIIRSSRTAWPRNYEKNLGDIQEIKNNLYAGFSTEQQELLRSKRFLLEKQMLIEPNVVKIISSLQQKGVTVLGLTARLAGAYGVIPSFPELTAQQLKDNGIYFNRPILSDIIFKDVTSEDGGHPIFHHGVLSTNAVYKGYILTLFLDYLEEIPDHVIFFDDLVENIEDVAVAMKIRGIPFTGYIYKGAEQLEGPFNTEVFMLQHKHLIEYGEWLTDEEAEQILFHARLLESIKAKLSCN